MHTVLSVYSSAKMYKRDNEVLPRRANLVAFNLTYFTKEFVHS